MKGDVTAINNLESKLNTKDLVHAAPICTMIDKVGRAEIKTALDLAITRLATRLNVKHNLTDNQMVGMVDELVNHYKNESLEDFLFVFSKARRGEFGVIYKLDINTICEWMNKHLEEKAFYREKYHENLKFKSDAANVNEALFKLKQMKANAPGPADKPVITVKTEVAVAVVSKILFCKIDELTEFVNKFLDREQVNSTMHKLREDCDMVTPVLVDRLDFLMDVDFHSLDTADKKECLTFIEQVKKQYGEVHTVKPLTIDDIDLSQLTKAYEEEQEQERKYKEFMLNYIKQQHKKDGNTSKTTD